MIKHILFFVLTVTLVLSVDALPDCEGLPDQTLIADLTDCRAFYVCIGGEVTHAECPPGMHFDPDINNCSLGDCLSDEGLPDCGLLPDQTLIADLTDCRAFYVCIGGEVTHAECPSEMHFDPVLITCMPGDCLDGDSSEETEPSTPDPTIESGITCPSSSNRNEIIFRGSNEDCARFHICVNSHPVRQYCRDGLHFNMEIKKCDFPENANCGLESGTRPPGGGLPHPEDGIPRDSNGLPLCPAIGQHFFSHPFNCQLYIACAFGFRTINQCPFHNHWDLMAKRCRQQNVAVCVLNWPNRRG